jgi:hypothetical protein
LKLEAVVGSRERGPGLDWCPTPHVYILVNALVEAVPNLLKLPAVMATRGDRVREADNKVVKELNEMKGSPCPKCGSYGPACCLL